MRRKKCRPYSQARLRLVIGCFSCLLWDFHPGIFGCWHEATISAWRVCWCFAHDLRENGGYCWAGRDRLVFKFKWNRVCCLFFQLKMTVMMIAKTLWDFSMLVWLSVTGKLLFWYPKQVNFESCTMSTRVLIGWHEIVDSDFFITDGLCEDMDSRNPIDFFNRFFEEEMLQNLVEKAGHCRTMLQQFFFCTKPINSSIRYQWLWNLTIIWLCPKIVFALTPPAPADPVLPNFNHVRICCLGWPGGHSFGFYFSISAQIQRQKFSK